MLTEKQLQQEIATLKGQKVTKEYIDSRIVSKTFTKIDHTATICSIYLDNGFSVRGESACVDPINYREDIGNSIAYDKAYARLWELFGFLLAEHRMQEGVAA